MNDFEVARVVAVGTSDEGRCSVVAIRRERGIVDLYPHGTQGLWVRLGPDEWDKLVDLPRTA